MEVRIPYCRTGGTNFHPINWSDSSSVVVRGGGSYERRGSQSFESSSSRHLIDEVMLLLLRKFLDFHRKTSVTSSLVGNCNAVHLRDEASAYAK